MFVVINGKTFFTMITQITNTTEELLEKKSMEFLNLEDVNSFSYLYDVYADSLFNWGCKLTGDYELLKDCIHDVFIKIYSKRYELGGIFNLKSYLFASLRNKLLDELKRKSLIAEKQVEEYYPVAEEDVEVDYIVQEKEELSDRKLTSLLSKLSERQKEAITLYYLEEKRYEDICVIMDINYQSLRNLIHRGLTKLRMMAS